MNESINLKYFRNGNKVQITETWEGSTHNIGDIGIIDGNLIGSNSFTNIDNFEYFIKLNNGEDVLCSESVFILLDLEPTYNEEIFIKQKWFGNPWDYFLPVNCIEEQKEYEKHLEKGE